ncbi:hypothetical protein CSA80_01200 [Candidatus Saccharibacteria bacterium]|nr:MAG: hypothetical protein CR973_01955 [Candidatus Saccharibacteria bacterium]PID99364.1 MAG: hypothetical protein CSA80_01200 [Candidatus Saccharibacteria bacterium]
MCLIHSLTKNLRSIQMFQQIRLNRKLYEGLWAYYFYTDEVSNAYTWYRLLRVSSFARFSRVKNDAVLCLCGSGSFVSKCNSNNLLDFHGIIMFVSDK